MFSPRYRFFLGGFAVCSGLGPVPLLHAQATGSFVIPAYRDSGGSRFSYWDRFALPGGTTASYFFDHFPNLLNLGDDEGNPSNWNTNAKLQQVLTPQCFVTSSGALYSFAAATGFEIRYTHTGTDPVAGAVLQIRYAGSAPDPSTVRLRYQPAGGGNQVLLAPAFKALDNPGTAGFAEQVMRGYEWNLTGLGVTDYVLQFSSVSSSMAFYQAQLDTTTGPTFQQALGFLLSTRAAPALTFGTGGRVVAGTAETRFFTAGQEVPLSATANAGFQAVGWIRPDGTVVDGADDFTLTFPATAPTDLAVAAVFAPVTWQAFRTHSFNHANTLTGTADDYLNEAISGPAADPDEDGMDNFSEYAFGGNPLLPDAARFAPQPVILTESGIRYPGLVFRHRAGESDLSWQVQSSTGLSMWRAGTEAAPIAVETPGPLEADGTRTVTVRSLTPLSATAVFLRIKALPVLP